jgi:arylsulfatase A-like enzyme
LGAKQVRHSRNGYYGSVSFVDEQIGRVLEVLEKRGMLDNTLILFTSDHGDMTGDHNLWRKSYGYEQSAHIPMLLRLPKGMDSGAKGQVRTEPVELRDVLPTFLDAAGAEPVDVEGKSLLGLVRGKTEWRKWIDLEHGYCYAVENHWNGMTDGRRKYLYHAYEGQEQLFDLEKDPHELKDLAGDTAHSAVLKQWRGRLMDHLAERGDQWVKGGRLIPRPDRMVYSPNYPKPSAVPQP